MGGYFQIIQTRAGHRAVLDHRTGEVMHPVVSPLREALQLYVTPSRLREPLGPEFLRRLARSSAPFPADAPADALQRLHSHIQFKG